MSFFKTFFAALIALFTFSFLVILFFILIITGLTASKPAEIDEKSVLHLKFDGPITEMQDEDPLEGLPVVGGPESSIGLLQLKNAIKHAESDPKIKGILLEAMFIQGGFATIEEIRQSLLDFRKSGKWVIAYGEVMSEGAYYLATAADDIYLFPSGEIEFNGLSFTATFFKRLLDKLEIKPQIFRVGTFKSAVEPFMLEKMSDESRLQLSERAEVMNKFMLNEISKQREISFEKLKEISDNMLVRNAKIAKELKLVDDLLYEDEVHNIIKKRIGIDEDKDIDFTTYRKYRSSYDDYVKSDNEIAVIVADGDIMPGESTGRDNLIGGDTFVKEIRKARENKRVKAIVIRINSPGGEFRASDMLWHEIRLAKKVKPVIASMSDYAASGGYYIAMACDQIVAQPNTITGSIGIFAMLPDMSSFLGNKIGITFDDVRTGKYGDLYTVSRPLTESEKNFLQTSVEEYYDMFTRKAAEGRNVEQSEIEKVAGGRVWTGSQASEIKLVDVLGGFNDAVRLATEKAGVSGDYRIRYYPEQKSFLEVWLEKREEQAQTNALKSQLGEYYDYYEQVKRLRSYQGLQARYPFDLQIQ